MRVALVSCRSPFLDDDRIYPPLALIYLKSALQAQVPDLEVALFDEYDIDDLSFLGSFDVVGISIMTPQRFEAASLADAIKRAWPQKLLVAGGPHVQHYSEELIDEPWDHLVRGDGERLLSRIVRGESIPRVSSDFLEREQLASMPRPDRLGEARFLAGYSYELQGLRATTMLTGRGCPMACKFCEDAKTTTRWSSEANVEAELSDIRTLGYQAVYLFDDLFAISLRRCAPYLVLLQQSGLPFRCNVHARFMSPQFAEALAGAGCVEVAFGAESGSQAMLDRMGKRTTVEQNYECVRVCQEAGIVVKAFLMLGLPGETRDTIAETERFIVESGVDDFQLAIYYPYKGTEFRRELDSGEASDFFFEGEGLGAYGQRELGTDAVMRTATLTSTELVEIRAELLRRYRSERNSESTDRYFDTHLATGGALDGPSSNLPPLAQSANAPVAIRAAR